jgi:anti-sigma B factor antagonist
VSGFVPTHRAHRANIRAVTLLRIGSKDTLDATVLAPIGDLDLGSVDRFEAAFAAAEGHTNVIVDLRRVEFMDSTGLLALLRAADELASRGGTLRVVPGPRCVDRLFDLTLTRSRIEFVEASAVDAPIADVWLG